MKSAMQSLASLDSSFHEPVDLFICSASFERRCLSIAEHLDGTRIGHVLIAHNQRFRNVVDANLRVLQKRFLGKESTLVVDSGDPVLTTSNVVEAIRAQRREECPTNPDRHYRVYTRDSTDSVSCLQL